METQVDQSTKRRLTRFAKNKKGKDWYKKIIDTLDYRSPIGLGLTDSVKTGYSYSNYGYDRSRSKRINYNLFNGIIDPTDFEYVYKPLGKDVGELPADFSNKDIVSGKIKVLMGMEMERRFPWRIIAVNEEATTRKEQQKFGMIREYVIQQIMQPIQENIQAKYSEMMKGGQLNEGEMQQIQQQMQQEMQAMKPEEIDYYMKRKHQDPAERLNTQIMNYVVRQEDVQGKFDKGWKHACISAEEVYWIGIINEEPVIMNVNPLYLEYDKDSDCDFIEDGEWAGTEMWLTPSQVVQYFGDELKDAEIDSLYEGHGSSGQPLDADWSFDDNHTNYGKVRVLHRAWKALRKMGFLQYFDQQTGNIEERIVDEKYELNPDMGDISIVWEWIPEVYEGYKLNADIYVRMRPVPAQAKNMDNLYECKLPYVGGVYDGVNSQPTSLVDRMKVYQYFYNIIMYRIEMLMASDKGKLLLMNMNMIPTSQKINMEKWLYYADALKIGFMNPNEEGNQGLDVTNAAKEIDMSLISDISKYIELAEYMERRCGETIGVTKEMEGKFGQYQTATSSQQAIAQGNYIVEPYFAFHNKIKKNALTSLMEVSVIAYSTNGKTKLNYILDDFSKEIINIDKNLLAMSHFGLFVADATETVDIKGQIIQLAHAAMQNQAIDMSDAVKVLRSDNPSDAEEKLEAGEERKQKQLQGMEQQKHENAKEIQKMQEDAKEKDHEREKELIVLKEGERRKTEVQKQVILSTGFNENKDVDDDGVPDVIELYKEGTEADIKIRKQNLDEDKFKHQKETDKRKLDIEEKKVDKAGAST